MFNILAWKSTNCYKYIVEIHWQHVVKQIRDAPRGAIIIIITVIILVEFKKKVKWSLCLNRLNLHFKSSLWIYFDLIILLLSCHVCLHASRLLCPVRRMTFGKVNEMGQFIREAEPEPDVKKSKGMTDSSSLLSTC